jgi:transcriptional regulator with XRE-family HTH domain
MHSPLCQETGRLPWGDFCVGKNIRTEYQLATIKDVAKLAGVSIATVSRVFNNRGYLSDEVKQKIAEAMIHFSGNLSVPMLSNLRSEAFI